MGSASVGSSSLSVDEWVLVDQAGFTPCGLVAGGAVWHVGMVGAQRGNVEVTKLSETMRNARRAAVDRLRDQIVAVRAAGAIGVHLAVEMFGGRRHTARFVAVGTAVRDTTPRWPTAEGAPPFVSSLSGREFSALVLGGYQPLGMVMGACIMHVRRRGPWRWIAELRTDAELVANTSALYEAREQAMGRLQAEALQLPSEGVVGIAMTEASHVWGSRVIEVLATGNAVRQFDPASPASPASPQATPQIVMSLHDPLIRTDRSSLRRVSATSTAGVGRRRR